MSFKIKGKAKYLNIGSGFWGIIDSKGNEWLPINMPEQLKSDGQNVECRATDHDGDSMHMWGKLVKIVSFKTISSK